MTTLFNKYEAMNEAGREVSDVFRHMIKNYIIQLSQKFSTVELEYIFIGELTGLLAEIRLKKALELKRAERMSDDLK